jgi:hypothetical protein
VKLAASDERSSLAFFCGDLRGFREKIDQLLRRRGGAGVFPEQNFETVALIRKMVHTSRIGSHCRETIPLPLSKRFQTSMLIDAAGCQSDTFRAWRNRNGLFPETQNSGNKWNRFSFIDVMVAAIVTELTKRGLSAQLAVDAAMVASPLLAKLSKVLTKPDDDVLTVVSALLAHWKKQRLPVLAIDNGPDQKPSVRLVETSDTVEMAAQSQISILVRLDLILSLCLSKLAIFDKEFEYSSNERHPHSGSLILPNGINVDEWLGLEPVKAKSTKRRSA